MRKLTMAERIEAHWRALVDIRDELRKNTPRTQWLDDESPAALVDAACRLLDEASDALDDQEVKS